MTKYLVGQKWGRNTQHAVHDRISNWISECGIDVNWKDGTSEFEINHERSCKKCKQILESHARLLTAANKHRQ